MTCASRFQLFIIDDTQYWNLTKAPEIAFCHSVYLVDTEQHTYCCEMTPSYFLRALDGYFELKHEVSDERREQLYDWFHEHNSTEDIYLQVSSASTVKRLPVTLPEIDPNVPYDEMFDDLAEHLRTNPIA